MKNTPKPKHLLTTLTLATLALPLVLSAAAQTQASLTVYTGRSKGLVDPLVQAYQNETGQKINVRYGKDAELYAALGEEGSKSPADIFWANSSAVLGALSKENKFKPLGQTILGKPAAFVPASNNWTPVSIRFRVLAYNPAKIKAEELPKSVLDLPKLEKLKGRIGWTPSYASFQDFIGAMKVLHGEAKTKEWLLAMKNMGAKDYAANNTQMLEALRAGEIDVALTNHYYVQRFTKVGYAIGTHYFASGDVGSLALVTGAGILKTSKQNLAANKFVAWLLSPKAQQFFPGELFEYPVVKNTILPSSLLPLNDMLAKSPKIDFEKLGDYVDDALKLLREVGLL